MTETTQPLPALWQDWRRDLLDCPALVRVARPALLPHLRAVDAAQLADTVATLGLDGLTVTRNQVAAAFTLGAPTAAAAGWPGALPPLPARNPGPVGAQCRADLGGYTTALMATRRTVLELLQGADDLSTLAASYVAWRRLVLAEGPDPLPAGRLAEMWELAGDERNWNLRAALLHLGIWRVEEGIAGSGRLARLVMNTVRAAAGHGWLTVPLSRRKDYHLAVRTALARGDAAPWAELLDELDAPRN